MSVSLIPDSAPFNAEQRAWLNGFLAGWLGVDGDPNALPLAAATEQAALSGPSAIPTECEPEDFPWHDASLPIVERLELAADRAYPRQLMACMAQLNCGACGYLCQSYAEAIADGTESCLTLCAPGGGETARHVKQLVKERASAPTDGLATNSAPQSPAPLGSRRNPARARLKTVRNLNKDGSEKHTSHVELEFIDPVDYRAGDALGVFPANCPDLVDAILDKLGSDGSETATLGDGCELSVRDALTQRCDLSQIDEDLAAWIARYVEGDAQRAKLQTLAEAAESQSCDLLDLLTEAAGAEIPVVELTQRLNALQPRLYSIASSPLAHPGEVHLTVGRVAFEVGGRVRKGVASTMFADRLQPGDELQVFVHASHAFAPPDDGAKPMAMVGPGTGIAPFRAFLQHRRHTDAKGPNWLFFGDQRQATDFLYEDELEAMVESGSLRVSTAFSRDQDEKVYVQNRMLEHGAELFEMLEGGGYFFVCGDARRMAADVDRALHELIEEYGSMSASQAGEYVDALRKSNRYVRDVY
ncbi:MAG: sulfite reductase subunit alpha [Planctomycetales bacterium]|nr:sulfite reductase subunit alpha [Planctomycetales bacterium]